MKLTQRVESDVTIVELEGRLDWNGLSEFSGKMAQIVDAGSRKILLNFARLEYMSSAGIRALIETLQKVETEGGKLAICSPNSTIQELFQVVQLDKVITIYPGEFEALDKLLS